MSFTLLQTLEFNSDSLQFFRLVTFSGMSASDDLTDQQARQMLFDMDSAYNAFNRFLA